ncbi:hypothetical protein FFZ99_14550 [Leptospira interrogans]|nr:hypothetical protein LEP1GSC200_3397 [Leptospira interrogans serovar Pomona str. CSL10083]KYZ61385.1 hypothetical protein AWU66_05390 [Leptospira interrogans serovar Pomona]TQE52102.1 hypothetical protein FF006_18965 [Leptospira interrogans]OMH63438.1 hypothetical protein BW243_12595 [Leptospira interrogans serovar Pomona]TQE61735.1 hypothetical protein FFZ99_14550 [Leptospira interrogans]
MAVHFYVTTSEPFFCFHPKKLTFHLYTILFIQIKTNHLANKFEKIYFYSTLYLKTLQKISF